SGHPQAERAWSTRGGYVSGFEQVFDPSGFAASQQEVSGWDPLVLWLLHCSRDALRGVRREGQRAGGVFGNLSFPSEGLSRYAERVWLERGGHQALLQP
ncbi:hypothetical protein L6R46_14050, partial [Myxococcota bacterium]|nr:hypothetical protein [Myxococcota bacterium]